MSYFEKFLKTNQAYADLHGTAHLPQKPKTHVAIVTCMDSRLHVAHALGLALSSYPSCDKYDFVLIANGIIVRFRTYVKQNLGKKTKYRWCFA